MIKVIDNLFSNPEWLYDEIIKNDTAWYYNPSTVDGEQDTEQFVHWLVDNNRTVIDKTQYVYPIFNAINDVMQKDIIIDRCKINYLSRGSGKPHTFHLDNPNKLNDYIALYYVNDNDGCTYIDKEVIEPKAGRLIIFKSDLYHTSSSPVNFSHRIVININFSVAN